MMVGFGEQRLAVALGERSAVDQVDRFVGQLEQADGVGKVATAPSESLPSTVAVTLRSSSSKAIVRASSITVRSSRAMFSMRATSSDAAATDVRSISAGIVAW